MSQISPICAAVEGSIEDPWYEVEPCGVHGSQSNGHPVSGEMGQRVGHQPEQREVGA